MDKKKISACSSELYMGIKELPLFSTTLSIFGKIRAVTVVENLPKDQKSQTWTDFIERKQVTWSGIIVDFSSDSVIVYGKTEGYNDEDWTTIRTEKKEMIPYIFIAELMTNLN